MTGEERLFFRLSELPSSQHFYGELALPVDSQESPFWYAQVNEFGPFGLGDTNVPRLIAH